MKEAKVRLNENLEIDREIIEFLESLPRATRNKRIKEILYFYISRNGAGSSPHRAGKTKIIRRPTINTSHKPIPVGGVSPPETEAPGVDKYKKLGLNQDVSGMTPDENDPTDDLPPVVKRFLQD